MVIMASNTNPHKLTDLDLLRDLRRVVNELGHAPTKVEYKEKGKHATRTFTNHFGTWHNAMDQIGVEYDEPPPNKIPEEKILNDIDEYVKIHGEAPSMPEFDEFVSYTAAIAHTKFESWSKAVMQAGYKPQNNVPEEVLLLDMVEVAEKLDKPPARQEYDEHGTYLSQSIVQRLSGTWQVLAKEAYQTATGEL